MITPDSIINSINAIQDQVPTVDISIFINSFPQNRLRTQRQSSIVATFIRDPVTVTISIDRDRVPVYSIIYNQRDQHPRASDRGVLSTNDVARWIVSNLTDRPHYRQIVKWAPNEPDWLRWTVLPHQQNPLLPLSINHPVHYDGQFYIPTFAQNDNDAIEQAFTIITTTSGSIYTLYQLSFDSETNEWEVSESSDNPMSPATEISKPKRSHPLSSIWFINCLASSEYHAILIAKSMILPLIEP